MGGRAENDDEHKKIKGLEMMAIKIPGLENYEMTIDKPYICSYSFVPQQEQTDRHHKGYNGLRFGGRVLGLDIHI